MLRFDPSLLPHLYAFRRDGEVPTLADPAKAVREGMAPYLPRVAKGSRIGIAAGSRGIDQYAQMVAAVAGEVRRAGALPVILPAMGSHGGATPEGQAQVLAGYGITGESMNAPILSSMETVLMGETPSGMPVYFSKSALEMDGLILVNRVKPHTDFSGEYESGVVKQLVIGLGKEIGASTAHRRGVQGLTHQIPEAARLLLSKVPVLMGIAILENARDKTARVEVLPWEDILSREPKLLEEARGLMPSLPADSLDVLVLQEMGKNVSGSGIDPNIVGRRLIRGVPDQKPDIYRVVCLDLTEESHGNAIGMGIADVITKRLRDKIDWVPTHINTVTSGFLERGFMPIVAETDWEALAIALASCNRLVTQGNARMILAKSTLDLTRVIASQALLPELMDRDGLVLEGEIALPWDETGNLPRLF